MHNSIGGYYSNTGGSNMNRGFPSVNKMNNYGVGMGHMQRTGSAHQLFPMSLNTSAPPLPGSGGRSLGVGPGMNNNRTMVGPNGRGSVTLQRSAPPNLTPNVGMVLNARGVPPGGHGHVGVGTMPPPPNLMQGGVMQNMPPQPFQSDLMPLMNKPTIGTPQVYHSANSQPTSTDAPRFDLSDFPALGESDIPGSKGPSNQSFTIQNEDFPALSSNISKQPKTKQQQPTTSPSVVQPSSQQLSATTADQHTQSPWADSHNEDSALPSVNSGNDPRFDINDFPVLGGNIGDQSFGGLPLSKIIHQQGLPGQFDYSNSSRTNQPHHMPFSSDNDVQTMLPSLIHSHPLGGVITGNKIPKQDLIMPSSKLESGQSSGRPFAGSGLLMGHQSIQHQNTMSSIKRLSSTPSSDTPDRFGLLGLLSVIRMTDPNLNTLALGTDLTTLGLNLNSQDMLYPTFGSPWSENPIRHDPDYIVPMCYYMQNTPAIKTSHLSKFQLETLFYIFYNMSKDHLQIFAAKELYNRSWKYHKELKLWFKNPTETALKGHAYIYFDKNAWEQRISHDSTLISQSQQFMTLDELKMI